MIIMIMKKCLEKQQQNAVNDQTALLLDSVAPPRRILEESKPLYNQKEDCLVPRMLIVDVNKDNKQFPCNV